MTHHHDASMDWYDGVRPVNAQFAPGAHLETSYTLAMFDSRCQPGLIVGTGSGIYGGSIITGPDGKVSIGKFSCLNSANVLAAGEIVIGSHALLGWGCVLFDTSPPVRSTIASRRAALAASAHGAERHIPMFGDPGPIVLEDNVWIGFGAVIGPGVTIGRASVVGARSIVTQDVPPYCVAAGAPARVVAHLPGEQRTENAISRPRPDTSSPCP